MTPKLRSGGTNSIGGFFPLASSVPLSLSRRLGNLSLSRYLRPLLLFVPSTSFIPLRPARRGRTRLTWRGPRATRLRFHHRRRRRRRRRHRRRGARFHRFATAAELRRTNDLARKSFAYFLVRERRTEGTPRSSPAGFRCGGYGFLFFFPLFTSSSAGASVRIQ